VIGHAPELPGRSGRFGFRESPEPRGPLLVGREVGIVALQQWDRGLRLFCGVGVTTDRRVLLGELFVELDVVARVLHAIGQDRVRVGHAGSITSLYGHLSRFAAGIREGVQVERGQIIGYVGATGLATGPHLHFAMDRDGEYVDPLALTAAAGARIPEPARRVFERVQAAVTRQLAALPRSAEPRTVSLSSAGLRAR